MKVTLKATINFPHIFEKDKWDTYSAQFILDNSDAQVKNIKDIIKEAGKEAFGAKWVTTEESIRDANKHPVKSGDKLAEEGKGDHYKDKLVIKAKHKIRPAVVGRDAKPLEDDGTIYAGALVNAVLDISTYKNDYGAQISVKLLGIQFIKDGERLSSAPVADAADFTPLTDGADAEDL